MAKKDWGLLVLLIVVGGITALLNPRFLSAVNLLDMANLIGLFGIFSIGVGMVIITGGIDLSVGSIFALLGVVFIDLLVNRGVPWPLAILAIIAGGIVLGAVQGLLVTKAKLQPFVVTLCGLLIYRGAARYYTTDATMGFGYSDDFDWLAWLASGRSWGIPHPFMILIAVAAIMGVLLHSQSAATRRRRASPASGPAPSSPAPTSSAAAWPVWRPSVWCSTPILSRPHRSAISTSSTRSPPRCWAAAACAAARAPSSASCSVRRCCRCCRTWSTSSESRAR
jgi:ABC-type xylose transport system permease subunit